MTARGVPTHPLPKFRRLAARQATTLPLAYPRLRHRVAADRGQDLAPGSGTYTGAASSATTNAGGVATVVVPDDSRYAVTATPTAGSGVVATTFPPGDPVTRPSLWIFR